jgi:hypothetical protein
MLGYWPKEQVDHIDRDTLNNKWENLRPASPRQNGANRKRGRNNTTGFKGVSKMKSGRYRVMFTFPGGRKHVGCFNDPGEANKIYMNLANKFFGEFASWT